MINTVLVVPVFNEARRFDPAPWLAWLATGDRALCFVDDGSRDGTPAMLEALQANAPPQISVITMPANAGKAEAVREGILRSLDSGARYVGFIDADLAAPLSEVAALEAELDAYPAARAAFGSRVKLLGRQIERSERRHYLGRIFATCASIALSLPVYDTQCGLKLFRSGAEVRAAFAAPFRSKWIFDVEILARFAAAAGNDVGEWIREVPLQRWAERGASRLRVRDFLRAPLELARIWRSRS